MSAGVLVRTPAKINLTLGVGPVRPDGFHELASIYQAVSLYDEVAAEPAAAGEVEVEVEGADAEQVPSGRSNLAVQAARLLADQSGVTEGIRLRIRKGIPVAGGMAGGSSDAAAALVACNALWETKLDRGDLLTLAARLGSDVPFCVLGGTAIGSGHGELVEAVATRGEYFWVLALDDGGLSTPAVYRGLDERRVAAGVSVEAPRLPEGLLTALRFGDVAGLGRTLTNDLQPIAIALRPELDRVLATGRELGALGAMVSGSGPTCAFLARDASHARDLAEGLARAGVVREVARATGPVPGARLV